MSYNKLMSSYQFLSLVIILSIGFTIASCGDDRFVIPEAGSVTDERPPEASFSFAPRDTDYKQIDFSNTSISATDFEWTFGDGSSSTDKDPTHTYATNGEYTVTLKAADLLGQSSTTSQTVTLVEPIITFEPEILNSGFDVQGADEYRDNWRNGDLGGVIQITSSPIHDGVKAAKLPSAGDRIGYQLITVEENKDYTISFQYTMKTSPVGSVEVKVFGNHVTDVSEIAGATIASISLNDQTSASDYVSASISFNSGSSTEIAIYFTNIDCESRLDSFTITED